MKFLIIATIFIVAQAQNQNPIKIKGKCYNQELLAVLRAVNGLRIDYSTNTLYFSYQDPKSSTTIASKYDLNTDVRTIIEGIKGYTQAVDRETNDVYLGGENGLFKYNKATNRAEFLGEKDVSIRDMWYRGTLYYTEFDTRRLHSFTNGKAAFVEEFRDTRIRHFVIDNEDVVFFSNYTGVYSQKKGTTDVITYRNAGNEIAKELNTDINGNVIYVVYRDGIYTVNTNTRALEIFYRRLYSTSITFENNGNIIYSDYSRLYRFRPTNTTC